jgi:hypothetical protein
VSPFTRRGNNRYSGEQLPSPGTCPGRNAGARLIVRNTCIPPFVSPESETTPRTAKRARMGRAIVVMAIVGVVIRLALAPFTSYPNDDLPWYWMAVSGLQHLPVYARPGFSYPPIWGWVLELLGRILGELGASPAALGVHDLSLNGANMATGGALATTITSPLLNVCIKSILTAADLGTACLLAMVAPFVSDRPRAREIAFGLYFLNPLVINETAVRAGIDGLVALSIAATLAMVVLRRPFLAGVALGIGVFVKLSPIVLAPLVLAALLSSSRRDPRDAIRFLAGGFCVAATVVVALLGTGQWSGFVENTFSRTQTGLLIGGPAFGGLRHFGALSNLLHLANQHSALVFDTSLAIEAAAVAGMTAWTWTHSRRSLARSVVLASTVTIAAVVATTPTSQPGYVLWFLGPLVLLASAKPWSYAPFAAVFSIAAVVFSLTYYSPAQLLFPLAEYTNLLNPHQLANSVQHWFLRPTGLWGASYKEDYASICAAAAMLAYLFLIAGFIDDRAFARAENRLPQRASRFPMHAVGGVLGLLVVAMVVSTATPPPAAGSTGSKLVHSRQVPGGFELTVSSHQVADERSLRTVVFPVSEVPATRDIYVVVDPTMPLGATTLEDVRGVFDELRATMKLRGYRGSVNMITSTALTRLLRAGPSPADTAVVDTSGVLPSAALSPGHDLLTPWLRRGGVLYWGGGPIGLWYADQGQSMVHTWRTGPATVLGPAADVTIRFLRQAQRPTPIASALDLQYQDAAFSPAVSEGSLSLGYTGDGTSSITSFPFDQGRLVVFGGLMYANAEVASDISLIQMSGVLYASGSVSTSTEKLGRWRATIPTVTGRLERVVIFDPRPSGISFSAFTLGSAGAG